MVVDGEHKNVPLLLELDHSEQSITGAINWNDARQAITAGSSEGPQLRFESKTDNATVLFNGLYRDETIEGRFTITFKIDPEPFPGQFRVTRQE